MAETRKKKLLQNSVEANSFLLQLFLGGLVDQSKLKHMNLAFFYICQASRGRQTQNCRKQILCFVFCPIMTALPTYSLSIMTIPTPIQCSCLPRAPSLTRVYNKLTTSLTQSFTWSVI